MAEDRAQSSGSYGTSRTVLVLSLIGLALAAIGVTILIDHQGGQRKPPVVPPRPVHVRDSRYRPVVLEPGPVPETSGSRILST